MDIKGKIVTVVGLGNSGVNAALLLSEKGARVKVTDASNSAVLVKPSRLLRSKGIEVETGVHTENFICGSGLVVLSPGVEDSSPAVRFAEKLRIPIIGEMELGYRFCKGKIIAVTGTNGKSTVTSLIGAMLKEGGLDTVICGNIGNSLCGEIPRVNENTWVTLEVSSFQLERIEYFKPHIALILNIRDDHMDRYARFSDYFDAKLKIFGKQDGRDYLILNKDAPELDGTEKGALSKVLRYSRAAKVDGAYVDGGRIVCCSSGKTEDICGVDEMKLKGLHNVENALASALCARIAGVARGAIKQAVAKFSGLAHRFETIDVVDGVEYVDDSKGTTVDSTYRALESCAKPVILITGGKDKHSDYRVIKDIVSRKVKKAVLIGEAAGAIKKAWLGAVDMVDARDMDDAVIKAGSFACEGSIVLLSPMCSSFDMFKDYKERGEVFKKAVRRIKDGR